MQTVLSELDWSGINVVNAFPVYSGKSGTKIADKGTTGFYQLGLKLGGYTEIYYNGEKLDFSDGTVLYLPCEKRDDIDYRKTIIEEGKSLCIFFVSDKLLCTKPLLIKCEHDKIDKHFVKLIDAYSNPETDYFDYIGHFYNIISQLNRILIGEEAGGESSMPDVIEYMRKHLGCGYIDLKALAGISGVSPDYFRHRFKQCYGISPLKYYHRLKVNYIKALICENKYSLGETAALSGFSDLNYFSRFFRKHTGMSPTEYIKFYSV